MVRSLIMVNNDLPMVCPECGAKWGMTRADVKVGSRLPCPNGHESHAGLDAEAVGLVFEAFDHLDKAAALLSKSQGGR